MIELIGWINTNIMESNKIWTKEKCLEFCKDCKSKTDLINKSRYVYKLMLKNDWFKDASWIKKFNHQVPIKWSKERIFDECRKYKTLSELRKSNAYLHRVVKKNNWVDELDLEIRAAPTIDCYYVYAYLDDTNKVVYVGLTNDKKRRHQAHVKNETHGNYGNSPVYKYFIDEQKIDIPKPIYLASKVSRDKALELEDYYVKYYTTHGYKALNKAKTGLISGAVGINKRKWDKDSVFAISKKFNNRSSFSDAYPQPYKIARLNGWLEEMDWLIPVYAPKGKWQNKSNVLAESQKYEYIGDFRLKSKGAYESARINGWLKEITWLKHKRVRNGHWTKDRVIEESKKYRNISEFEKHCSSGVMHARKNGWTKDLQFK